MIFLGKYKFLKIDGREKEQEKKQKMWSEITPLIRPRKCH